MRMRMTTALALSCTLGACGEPERGPGADGESTFSTGLPTAGADETGDDGLDGGDDETRGDPPGSDSDSGGSGGTTGGGDSGSGGDSGATESGAGETSGGGDTGGSDSGGGETSGGETSGGGDTGGGDTGGGDTGGGGAPDYGNCGWASSDGWYACGGSGEDPSGQNPIACPTGVTAGAACGAVDVVGCCDTNGTNYYCNSGGTITADECGGVDPNPPGDGDGDGDTGATGTGGDGDGDNGNAGDPGEGTLARNLSLGAVEVTQGVAIGIGQSNNPIGANSRNARLVKGRDALFRAGWSTQPGWQNRSIEGRLIIEQSGGSTRTYTDTLTVSGSPNFGSISGTFAWEVDGDYIQPGATYTVGLYEVDSSYDGVPQTSPAPRLPSNGRADLGVPSGDMELDLVLVPVRWSYNGQTREPNLSASDIETIRRTVYERNPVSSVNVTVRNSPVSWNSAISLDGILQAVSNARSQDNPAPNVYYEGLADFGCAYVSGSQCNQWGGTTGIGYVAGTSSWSNNQRASLSIWYDPASSSSTLNHELGHNQGRNHSPCGGVSGADASYPYSGGVTGVQGWQIGTNNLFSGGGSYDYMGYCSPSWVSDWTWEATATRIATLATMSDEGGEGWMLQGVITPEGEEFWTIVRGSLPEEALDESMRIRYRVGNELIDDRPALEMTLSDEVSRVIVSPLPEMLTADVMGIDLVDSIEREESYGAVKLIDPTTIRR